MATATPVQYKCPICQQPTMRTHCDKNPEANCTMFSCDNAECGAVIDPRRRIGHALDPRKAGVKPQPRLRLIQHPSLTWGFRDV